MAWYGYMGRTKSIQAKRNLSCHPRALSANNAVTAV